MHIKICGITSLDDALAAIDAGADYLGFNFYTASPRYIAPERCAKITSALGAGQATLVGLFVNETAGHVMATLAECGLQLAQLHGDEAAETVEALRGCAFKAFRGMPGASLDAYTQYSAVAPALLLDAKVDGAFGGTGVLADWSKARELARRYPILLAGGLKPENVAEAVRQVGPWGVDVASGVESAPGKKDPAKMRAFVDAVKSSNSP